MKNNLTIICAVLCCVICLGVTGYTWINQPKTAYVNLGQVFKEFDGKKELEATLVQIQQRQKLMLDSLNLKFDLFQKQLLEQGLNRQEVQYAYEAQRVHIQQTTQRITEQQQNQQQEFTENIWNQIDQYVRDYGEENGYNYIHGANGNGSLMYVSEGYDITDDIIEFLNLKYAGS